MVQGASTEVLEASKSFDARSHLLTGCLKVADEYEANPCEDQWHNMANDMTSRMWGVFDETGIFVCLCHHGFVAIAADMVQSGELAKYPLAVLICSTLSYSRCCFEFLQKCGRAFSATNHDCFAARNEGR